MTTKPVILGLFRFSGIQPSIVTRKASRRAGRQRSTIIGLTGGIGSGKTSVGKLFAKLGAQLIEADQIGHVVLEIPQVKKTLIKWFGRNILQKTGQVNRKKLARRTFVSADNIRRLNRLTHPRIKQEIIRQIRRPYNKEAVRIIDAPLLFETGLNKFCDYVIFVKASLNTRRARTAATRKWDESEIKRREAHQISIREKEVRSDFVINNNHALETTLDRVKKIYQSILKESGR